MSFDHRFNELAKISLMMKMVTFKIQNMKTIFHDYVVGFKFKNNLKEKKKNTPKFECLNYRGN